MRLPFPILSDCRGAFKARSRDKRLVLAPYLSHGCGIPAITAPSGPLHTSNSDKRLRPCRNSEAFLPLSIASPHSVMPRGLSLCYYRPCLWPSDKRLSSGVSVLECQFWSGSARRVSFGGPTSSGASGIGRLTQGVQAEAMTDPSSSPRGLARVTQFVRSVFSGLLLVILIVGLGLGVARVYRPDLVQRQMFIAPRTETWVLAVGQTRKEFPQSGGALAALLSVDTPELRRRCVVQPSPGSTYNLQALVSDNAELGLVQSQIFYPGQHETSAGNALHAQVRVLGQLFTSMLTLLATDASGIRHIEDLKGKRVGGGRCKLDGPCNPGLQQAGTGRGALTAGRRAPEGGLSRLDGLRRPAPGLDLDETGDALPRA